MSRTRTLAATGALLACCLFPCALGAQEGEGAEKPVDNKVYTVALFAPDINFSDSISKSGFITGVAASMAARTGLKWRGVSFARAGDFSAQASSGKVDYAVIGGTWCASACIGTVIAHASGKGSMAVVGRGGSVSSMKGRTLILPQPAQAFEGFVTSTLLGHQVSASEFFNIKYTGDARSAIKAVKAGQADLTVSFDAYASGLGILYKTPASPLPVVTQVNQSIDPDTARMIAKAFRGLPASGGGIITGFGGSGKGLKTFRGYAFSKPRAKSPIMAAPRPLKISFPVIRSSGLEQLSDTGQETLISAPTLREEDP